MWFGGDTENNNHYCCESWTVTGPCSDGDLKGCESWYDEVI